MANPIPSDVLRLIREQCTLAIEVQCGSEEGVGFWEVSIADLATEILEARNDKEPERKSK
jgi:hypothetical protein